MRWLPLAALLGCLLSLQGVVAPPPICRVEVSKSSTAPAGVPPPLGLLEMEMWYADGTKIVPTAAVSSSVWTDNYFGPLPPTNLIDGSLNDYTSMAATADKDPNPWLGLEYDCSGERYAAKVVVVNRNSRPRCEQCQYRLPDWYSLKSYDANYNVATGHGELLVLNQTSARGTALDFLTGEIPFAAMGEPQRIAGKYVLFPGNQCFGTIRRKTVLPRPTLPLVINLLETTLSKAGPVNLVAGLDVQVGLSTEWQPGAKYGSVSLVDGSLATFGSTNLTDLNPRLIVSVPCTDAVNILINNRLNVGTGYCPGGCMQRIQNFRYERTALTTTGPMLDGKLDNVFNTAVATYSFGLHVPTL